MAVNGVHFLARDNVRDRLAQVEREYVEATQAMDEVLKHGDLRESGDYDILKANIGRLTRERDELIPVLGMEAVRSNDAINLIEEGSIVKLDVWSVTKSPVDPGSAAFIELKKGTPAFSGVLMYGAALNIHELLQDKILSMDAPVSQFLLGKKSGDYSVAVPAGFSNISVEKLPSTITVEELYCKFVEQ